MYDVVIVGCGPAGLMAAREAKKGCLNFICLEAKKEIGEPLRCGEGINKKDFLNLFKKTSYDFVVNEVSEHEIIYEHKRIIRAHYLELDKPKFEKWLAKPVRKQIMCNTFCKNIAINRNYVKIETNKEKIKAKLVIITTGPNFTLTKELGLIKKMPELVPCYGGIYHNFKLNNNKFYFYYDTKNIGYFWVFPKGKGKVNIGYGGYVKNPREEFEKRMKQYKFSKLVFEKEFGGVLPLSGPIKKTYGDRVLVAGTAAGLIHIGSVEGNYYALRSGCEAGKVAVQAVNKNNFKKAFLKRYENCWKQALGKRLEAGMVFKKIEKFGKKFDVLEKIFDIADEEDIKKMITEGTPRIASIVYYLIKHLHLLSPKVTKESFRFKSLMFFYRLMKKLKVI